MRKFIGSMVAAGLVVAGGIAMAAPSAAASSTGYQTCYRGDVYAVGKGQGTVFAKVGRVRATGYRTPGSAYDLRLKVESSTPTALWSAGATYGSGGAGCE